MGQGAHASKPNSGRATGHGSEAGHAYEVRVAGHVPIKELLEHIEEAEAAAHRADTTVSVRLPDQAALHAFLHRLRSLGLEVTEVRRVPDPAKTPTNGEGVT
jgi:hypothetical protein